MLEPSTEIRQIEKLRKDFIEEFGWSSLIEHEPTRLDGRGVDHFLHGVCELGGLIIFAVTSADGLHPDGLTRKVLMSKLKSLCYENVAIFINQSGTHLWCRNNKVIETPTAAKIKETIGLTLFDWEKKDGNFTIIDASTMVDALFGIDRLERYSEHA